MIKPVWSLECLGFDKSSCSQLPGSLRQDYKYMHAKQIPHQLSFPSQTILSVLDLMQAQTYAYFRNVFMFCAVFTSVISKHA